MFVMLHIVLHYRLVRNKLAEMQQVKLLALHEEIDSLIQLLSDDQIISYLLLKDFDKPQEFHAVSLHQALQASHQQDVCSPNLDQ